MPKTRGSSGADHLDELCAQADAKRIAGDTDAALPLYEAAVRSAERLGDTQRLGQIFTSLAKVHQGRDELDRALTCCERSLALSLQAGDLGNAGRCLLTSARIHFYRGLTEQAHADLDRALMHARTADDRARVAEALALRGFWLVLVPERQQEGLDDLLAAVELCTTLNDTAGLIMSTMLLGDAQSQLGDYARACKSFAQARNLCHGAGNRTEEGIALINLALAQLELGDFQEAARLAEVGHDNAAAIAHPFQEVLTEVLQVVAHAHLGRLAGAEDALMAAVARARTIGNRYLEALVLPQLMAVRLLAGRPRAAIAAGAALAALGHGEAESRRHALLAEAHGRLGQLRKAEAHAEQAWLLASESCSQGHMAWALRAKALVAFAQGDGIAAHKAALASQAIAARLELRYLAALLEGLLGEIALADGKADAETRFRTLTALARQLQLPLLETAALAGAALAASGDAAAVRRQRDALLADRPARARDAWLRHGPWAALWTGLERVNS